MEALVTSTKFQIFVAMMELSGRKLIISRKLYLTEASDKEQLKAVGYS